MCASLNPLRQRVKYHHMKNPAWSYLSPPFHGHDEAKDEFQVTKDKRKGYSINLEDPRHTMATKENLQWMG